MCEEKGARGLGVAPLQERVASQEHGLAQELIQELTQEPALAAEWAQLSPWAWRSSGPCPSNQQVALVLALALA